MSIVKDIAQQERAEDAFRHADELVADGELIERYRSAIPKDHMTYLNSVCKGSLELGNACRRCERCLEQLKALEGFGKPSEPHPSGDAPLCKPLVSDAIKISMGWPSDKPNPNVHQGLPVPGYKKEQPAWAVALVAQNKVLEELVLRQIDAAAKLEVPETRTESHGHYGDHDYTVQVKACDGRQLALARTKLEEAFYHMNRAVFQPSRVDGPLDLAFAAELSS